MEKRPKNRLLEWIPIALLLALALVALWPAACLSHLPYAGDLGGSDLTELNWPRRVALARSLAAGRLPLWSDALHNGFPFLAEGQTGVLYPPNLLLFGLLPPLAAFNASLILTLFAAGLFTYLLARALGASRSGALLAGLTFMLCGFFVARIKHVNMIQAGCWLPLLLLLAERCARERRLRYAAAAGGVLALMVLAGHPQIPYCSALAATGWLLAASLRHSPERGFVARLRFALGALLLMGSVAGALAAGQILPTLELTRFSHRAGGLSLREATELFPFRPVDLLGLLAPYWRGNPAQGSFEVAQSRTLFWEGCIYVGLVALFLAAVGIWSCRQRPEARRLGGIGLVALLLALGASGGVYLLAWHLVPGMRFFRFPVRFLLVVQLALAVLAGFGLDTLRARVRDGKRHLLAAAVISLAAADLLLFARAYIGWVDARAWMEPPPTARILHQLAAPGERVYSLAHVTQSNGTPLFHFFWKNAYTQAKGWKGDMTPYLEMRKLLAADGHLAWGLSHFADCGLLEGVLGITARAGLEEVLARAIVLDEDGAVMVMPGVASVLALYHVRWLLSPCELHDEALARRQTVPFSCSPSGELHLYENRRALPRAYVTPYARVIGPPEGAENAFAFAVARGDLDPAWTTFLDAALPVAAGHTSGATVRVTAARDGLLRLEARLTGDGYLVVTDNYYPGWQATLDGEPVRVVRANLLSRALYAPAGRHQIEFRFVPTSFRAGLYLTLLALLTLSAWAVGAAVCQAKERRA